MKCKLCKVDKDLKSFHNLDMGQDNVCSECRAKERIAKREGKEFRVLNEEGCFADSEDICLILKEKNCYRCAFRKTIDQVDDISRELLEIQWGDLSD